MLRKYLAPLALAMAIAGGSASANAFHWAVPGQPNAGHAATIPAVPGQPIQFNLAHPSGYAAFMNPATYAAMMNPATYAQFMNPGFYMQFANPENWMAWMNPASYAVFMNPASYMQMMNPAAYMQFMNPAAYMQFMNPASYAAFMNPASYMQWMDPNAYGIATGQAAGAGTAINPAMNPFDPNAWAKFFDPNAWMQGYGMPPAEPAAEGETPETPSAQPAG